MTYDLGIIKRQRYIPPPVTGTGGTIASVLDISNNNTYVTHVFTASGALVLPSGVSSFDYIVVGGGGGGGAAGGGAGGFRTASSVTATTSTYVITIGGGGSGKAGSYTGAVPTNGTTSTFSTTGSVASTSIASAGGGSGQMGIYGIAPPGSGGSGGGGNGAVGGLGNTPATVPSQGNNGGDGTPANSPAYGAAGGGGAGAVGGNGSTSGGATGGAGTYTTMISPTLSISSGVGHFVTATNLVWFAGGGGGGIFNAYTGGNGGNGGGGAAGHASGDTNYAGISGKAFSGGGGGGGSAPNGDWTTNGTGGNGGAGVVIVRYAQNTNSVPPYDASFNQTSLLLSNQSTVNSFVSDASTNTALISIFGDTRPYTFNPYNHGYYSNYFGGSDYYVIPHGSAIDLTSGDFTVECWAYPTALSNGIYLFNKSGVASTNVCAYAIQYLTSNNAWNFSTGNSTLSSGNSLYTFGTGSNVLNTWLHFAATRSGTTIKTYLNGVLSTSTAQGTAIVEGNRGFVVGSQNSGGGNFTGYISNVRVVKGQVLYTSNFTPPTAPLTVTTNTGLLTSLSNRFIDSSNATTVTTLTITGTPQVSPHTPFFIPGTIPRTPNSYSILFNGTNYENITATSSTSYNLTGDFTIECWIYRVNNVDGIGLFGIGSTDPDSSMVRISSGKLQFWLGGSNSSGPGTGTKTGIITCSTTLLFNTWYHVALVRSGSATNNVKLYLNGVLDGQGTGTYQVPANSLVIGRSYPGLSSEYFNGYISNFRLIKDQALYIPASVSVSYLVVAGGGAGGTNVGGGGGAGGLLSSSTYSITYGTPYTITIGAGGVAASGNGSAAANGGNSVFGSITAIGGGGGANQAANGASGGSGGGGGWYGAQTGGAGTAGQGYAGAPSTGAYYAGGGGGAGGASTSAAGGVGVTSSISGASVTYATGGSAGFGAGTDAPANTGNGGPGHDTGGGNGGSGVVIIAYPNSISTATFTVTGNPRIANTGSNIVYTFTASGSIYMGPAFVVPTTALTTTTNTVLLTAQSDRIVDVSNIANTLTTTGTVKVMDLSPFGYTTGTITTNLGGGFFDGTGDYLALPISTSTQLGSNNFTIDFWMYVPTLPSARSQLTYINGNVSGYAAVALQIASSNKLGLSFSETGSTWKSDDAVTGVGSAITASSWQHVAIARNGQNIQIYLNGVAQGAAYTTTAAGTSLMTTYTQNGIGAYNASSSYFTGYISNFRLINGQALYTAPFAVPALPSTATTSTRLLTLQTNVPANNKSVFDYSVFNNRIAALGTPAQGNFSPYGNNWSLYFNGSNAYLTPPTSFNTAMVGWAGSTWTMECWVNVQAISSSGYIMGTYAAVAANGRWYFAYTGTTALQLQFTWTTGTGSQLSVTTTATFPLGAWTHVAMTINATTATSSTITLYINGVGQTFTGNNMSTQSTNYSNPTIGFVAAGNYANCFISNFRIIKGSIAYTDNFVIPKSSFGLNNSGSLLMLTCASNRIVDVSNTGTYTISGTPIISRYSPFLNQGYNKSVIGGSIYFPASTDYLTTPVTIATSGFGTGDFTVEAWIYPTVAQSTTIASSNYSYGTAAGNWAFYTTVGAANTIYFNGGAASTSGANHASTVTATIPLNQWTHIVYTRRSAVGYFFINGVQLGAGVADTTGYAGVTGTLYVGRQADGTGYLTGYMSDLRITKGTALYTANFAAPSAPLRPETNTTLLLNMSDPAVSDASMISNVVTTGNTRAVVTTIKKYNSTLMYFDGTAGTLSIPASGALNLSGGVDFTIECWYYSPGTPAGTIIEKDGQYAVAFPQYEFSISGSQKLVFTAGAGNQSSTASTGYTGVTTLLAATWYHFAVVKSSTTIKMFVNGNQELSTTQGTALVEGGRPLLLGITTGNPFTYSTFYLDDLRITRGVARYIVPFTPPIAPPKIR